MWRRFRVTAEQTLPDSFLIQFRHFPVAPQLSQRIGLHTIDPEQLCHDPGLQCKKQNAEPLRHFGVTAEQTLPASFFIQFVIFPPFSNSTNLPICIKSIQHNCVRTPLWNAKKKRNRFAVSELRRNKPWTLVVLLVIHHFPVVPQLKQRTGVHTIEPVHLFNDPGLQCKA